MKALNIGLSSVAFITIFFNTLYNKGISKEISSKEVEHQKHLEGFINYYNFKITTLIDHKSCVIKSKTQEEFDKCKIDVSKKLETYFKKLEEYL